MADAHDIANRFRNESRAAPAKAHRATGRAAQGYAGLVAKAAPYDTGHYAGSINAQDATTDPMRPTFIAGSNVEYGPRLEHGFVGTDRAGRTYNQGPRPHWRTNLRAGLKLLADELSKAFRR